MKYLKCFLLFFILTADLKAQKITNFVLTDAVTGRTYSLDQMKSSPAIVLVFSSLSCPFSKLYEDRIMSLNQKHSSSNVAFVMINPHSGLDETESSSNMAKWAKEKGYSMPYLMDNEQKVTKMTGMTKIPEVVVINSGPTGYSIAYKGAIDNNAQSAQSASMHYLDNAIQNMLDRKRPSPAKTRAVGCNIKLSP